MSSPTRYRLCILAASVLGLAGPGAAQPSAEQFGSTDGARVAYPMPQTGDRPTLRFLARRLSEDRLAELGAVAPNVEVVAVGSAGEALELAPTAHGADASLAGPEFIRAASRLVWVQSPSAGVDRYLENEPLMGTDRIVLTNMRAVHGPTIADHAMAMLLYQTRNLAVHTRNQRDGLWGSADARRGIALEGRTMFVVGLGGIGTEIAQRAHGFGMRVIGSRRSDRPNPGFIEYVGKPDELLDMLPGADIVAIALPLTPETEGLFGSEAFGAMREGAYLINIARGAIVDTDALVEALDSGKLAGACLDVTDPEPLPAGHTLWGRDNVIITPPCRGRGRADQRAVVGALQGEHPPVRGRRASAEHGGQVGRILRRPARRVTLSAWPGR